jgi:hypothetical protein
MAATVLNSRRAVQMSVFVVRAFVRLRELLATNREFAIKIEELECRFESHDASIQQIISVVRGLMFPRKTRRRRIGFEPPVAAS